MGRFEGEAGVEKRGGVAWYRGMLRQAVCFPAGEIITNVRANVTNNRCQLLFKVRAEQVTSVHGRQNCSPMDKNSPLATKGRICRIVRIWYFLFFFIVNNVKNFSFDLFFNCYHAACTLVLLLYARGL